MFISFRNVTHRFVIDDFRCVIGHMDTTVSNPEISGLHIYIPYDVLGEQTEVIPACYYDVSFDNRGNVSGIEYVGVRREQSGITFTSDEPYTQDELRGMEPPLDPITLEPKE